MPSAVPAPLASIAGRLRCPTCLRTLAPVRGSLACSRGHSYDVARQGYVTLLPAVRRSPVGDDAGMLAARAAIQNAGYFEPLSAALAETARALCPPDPSVILDAGAGTAHHLGGVLDTLPGALGVAVDISRAASRRAARAHSRMASVRGDIWRAIPLADATVDLALSVFAPRNAEELARVLRPGGAVIVATPAAEHLHELATFHTISIDPAKVARLQGLFSAWPSPDRVRQISWTMSLTHADVTRMLAMGPSARHLRPDFQPHLATLTEPVHVSAAIELRTFRHPQKLSFSSE